MGQGGLGPEKSEAGKRRQCWSERKLDTGDKIILKGQRASCNFRLLVSTPLPGGESCLVYQRLPSTHPPALPGTQQMPASLTIFHVF